MSDLVVNPVENASEPLSEESTVQDEKPQKYPNLAKRWSKKQPTKLEMMDSLQETRSLLLICSNNQSVMSDRITALEKQFVELVEYVNARIG